MSTVTTEKQMFGWTQVSAVSQTIKIILQRRHNFSLAIECSLSKVDGAVHRFARRTKQCRTDDLILATYFEHATHFAWRMLDG